MGLAGWLLVAAALAAGLGVTAYTYRRWEAPGEGRRLLLALRWSALAILLALIASPPVPAPGAGRAGGRDRVLLDESLSMAAPADGGGQSRWARAVAEARARAGGREVMLFGGTPRMAHADSLARRAPESPASRLLPALQAAAEAGARRVTVVTDGAIDDAAAVAAALPGLGLEVDVVQVGGSGAVNRALVEVAAPGWVASGDTLAIEVGIGAWGGAGEEVDVVVEHDGTEVARARVRTPEPGRTSRAEISFVPDAPEEGGLLRYEVRIDGSDAVPDDDVRSVYVHVSADPPGVAILSLRPDWEPRFLLPVLEEALGLPVSGFLRAASGKYVRVGTGADAGRPYSEEEVRRALASADLIVLHGVDGSAPGWVTDAARAARRLVVFPAPGGFLPDIGIPLELSLPSAGEWYPHAEVPPSPVAPLLGAIPLDRLPPLVGVRLTEAPPGAWAPLLGSRDRRGIPSPFALAGERGGRRWVVALADGFWRWAFRGDEARQAYRHLWGSLAGWLIREERAVAMAPVRPATRTVERGRPIEWVAPGLAPDSLAVRIAAEDGTLVADTVVAALRPDTATTVALPPGHYRYEVTAFARGEAVANSDGPLTVERYSPEFADLPGDLPEVARAAGEAGGEIRSAGASVPLHTVPWPYVALVAILAAEWILRRRWGLR